MHNLSNVGSKLGSFQSRICVSKKLVSPAATARINLPRARENTCSFLWNTLPVVRMVRCCGILCNIMCKPLKSLGIFLLHSKSVVASEGEEDSSFPRGGRWIAFSLFFNLYILYVLCVRVQKQRGRLKPKGCVCVRFRSRAFGSFLSTSPLCERQQGGGFCLICVWWL